MRRPFSFRVAVCVALVGVGCSHAWDDYDPRPSGGAPTASGAGGAGANGPAGSGGQGASVAQSSGAGASSNGVGASGGDGPGSGGAGGSGTGGATIDCAANGTQTFTDDFEDGVLGPEWEILGNATEAGGMLELAPGADPLAGTFARIRTLQSFDLRSCALWVRALQTPAGSSPTAYAALVAYVTDAEYTEIIEYGGNLTSVFWLGGERTAVHSVPSVPTEQAYWRIREDGGTTHYEVSMDGISYLEHSSVVLPFELAAVRPALTSGTDGATMVEPEPALFDRLNLPP